MVSWFCVDADSDLWWKNAVVYCLNVEKFQDTDGDGCSDLRLIERRRSPRAWAPRAVADVLLPHAQPRRRLDITDYLASIRGWATSATGRRHPSRA